MKKRAYSSFEKERKIFAAVMLLVIIVILAAGVMELCGVFEDKSQMWKPTEVYPMANANISWLETHYPGPWGVISDGN